MAGATPDPCTVIFPFVGHHCYLTGIYLNCSVTGARVWTTCRRS